MKVVFIGSHGTGKTTLCREMRKIDNNYKANDGVSRPIKKCKDRIGLSSKDEQLIINELTFFNWEFYKTVDNIFLTRSPLDCEVYSRVFGWEDLAEECENRIREIDLFNTEDVIWVYLPIEFELDNDGVRFMDEELQKSIDKEFKRLIKKYNINVFKVQGSIEKRVNKLKQIINNYE